MLVRWPRFFWRPREDAKWEDDWPVVERAWLEDYTLLAPDLTVWCEQLEPRFRRLDHRAQILQNQFWRQRVTLIGGGLVATALATVQAAVGGGIIALAVVQAGLTGLLAGLTHGLIRTAHAVRCLSATEYPKDPALQELSRGLAYWAARYRPLPGEVALTGAQTVGEAVAALDRPGADRAGELGA